MRWTKEQYVARLRDPRWQKKRLEVLERDDWTCQICFSASNTLHVHHLWYSGIDPWEYPLSALKTLCESCHEVEGPELKAVSDDLLQMLKQAGAMSDDLAALRRVVRSREIRGAPDQWSVLAFGLGELLDHQEAHSGEWKALEERYYAHLRANMPKPDPDAAF